MRKYKIRGGKRTEEWTKGEGDQTRRGGEAKDQTRGRKQRKKLNEERTVDPKMCSLV